MQQVHSTEGEVLVVGRLLVFGLTMLLTGPLVAPAAGAAEPATGWNPETGIYEMVFPVAEDHSFENDFGACRARCTHRHEGIDILADKMTPVVAAASGTVGFMRDRPGRTCCALALDHDDGWRTWYVHLNNDTPGTDDGMGWGFAPGIAAGVHVEAGQLIGYVGDSGTAEKTPPHLHFELLRPNGREINPYDHLRAAEVLALAAGVGSTGGYALELFLDGVLGTPPEANTAVRDTIWSYPERVFPR